MRAVWGVAAALALVGCSTPMGQLRDQLGPRASSWLGCPQEKLEYTELDRLLSTTKVRVEGCGKKATYELVESKWQNTASQSRE